MKSTQRGISLLETIGALAVGSMILMGMTAMIDATVNDAKGQQAALHQERVVNAAGKYISANYADLVTNTAGGTVGTITVAQLKAGGFLSDSFSPTNAFNQTSCVLVRQPASGKLDALVATYGGMAIPERDIPFVAMLAGQGGGYISTAVPGTARGASWELATTSYQGVACGGTTVLTGAAANDGGHLVSSLFYDGPGQLSTDFLYRNAVPGRPQLNQMNTPIAMAGAALVTRGAACGSEAAVGIDVTTRRLLVCGNGDVWQEASPWRESVENHGDLPTTGSAAGDVRMVTALSRAFTYNGSSWVALAIDEANNMNVPGTLSASSVQATSQITTDGFITAQGNITSEQMVIADGVQGNRVVGEYWMESDSIYIDEPVAAGTACHIPAGTGFVWAIGTIMRDSNGYLLSCAWDRVFRYQDGSTTPRP